MSIILPVCSPIIVNSFGAIIITKYLEGFLQIHDRRTTKIDESQFNAIYHDTPCHQIAI
ncbi:hypothetical protein [Lysinibacillus fusiformis]|uniref:hypothetical protein n=1 Tax=Lysinibacillus fusiformis TaxID=28031 RepID=UPI000A9FA32F